jgi:bifunctional N-acetylglucosamine-1-phosphate-uridyltransferase/glucosamine-1-phosphate-acetyltransferase GlmU-like protein
MSAFPPHLFFDLSAFSHRDMFEGCQNVWEALGNLSNELRSKLSSNVLHVGCFGKPLPQTVVLWKGAIILDGFEIVGGDVTKGTFLVRIGGVEAPDATVIHAGSVLWDDAIQLGPGAVVEPGALIKGPTIIGARTEVRQGAYIRGKCIIGDQCVVGHTTEMKSSVMLDGAKAGHFAYIGDSILGNGANLGAGTKLANLKIKEGSVKIRFGRETLDTGLRKFGAVIGDHTEIGCNTVTNPGTLLGQSCAVFPLTSVASGYYPSNSVVR